MPARIPSGRRATTAGALATVYGGFTVATLTGGPLGLVAAQAVGWRGVLGVVAAFGVAAALGTLAARAAHST